MMHRLAVLAKQAGIKGLFAGLGPRMGEHFDSPRRCVLTNQS